MGQIREKAVVYDTGDIVEIDAAPARKQTRGRRKSWQYTSAEQKWVNARKRARYVRRLLALNFSSGAILFTLTYADEYLPDTMEEVKRDFANFLRNIGRRYKKEQAVFKYMGVIERGEDSGRVHIHVVMSGGITRREILATWRKAHGVWEDAAEFAEWGFDDIAGYLLKDVEDAERYEHAYKASKNLERPRPESDGTPLKRMADAAFTKNFCEDLSAGNLTRAELNARFPGFKVLDFKPSDVRYNPYNRGYIVHMRLLRVGAKLPDWATTKKERDWMDSFADLYLRCIEEHAIRDGESLPEESERLYGALRAKWEEMKKA